MSHDEAAVLLGAYALDAVGEDEAALVAAHVAECPRCTVELAEHLEVAGMLGNMGGDAPRELWDRIASQATRPSNVPAATPTIAIGPSPGAERRHRRQGSRAPWAIAGAVVAVGAVTVALMGVQISGLNDKVTRLASIAQQHGISSLEQAALLNPSTRRVLLVASPGTTRAQAEVVLERSGQSYFVNVRLATLPATKTYQLWAIGGHTTVSLGLLGNGTKVVPFVVSAARPTALLAVTVERAGGAVAPTSHPVAVSAVHV